MEIPVVNRIIDFEANHINPLNNPSLDLSQVSAISGISEFYQAYNICKWGALILALLASFTTIVNKIKILVVRLQKHHSLASSQQHHLLDDDDYDSEMDTSSSFSDDSEEEEDEGRDSEEEDEEETAATTSFTSWGRRVYQDFRVRGSGHVYIDDEQWQNRNLGLRRRRSRRSIGDLFSWSELTAGGKSVVKLWDNLGLGFRLNVEESSESELAVYDMNDEREILKLGSVHGRREEIPALVSPSSSSPAVIFSAATNAGSRLALSGWDMRIGSQIPAILAEWRPKLGDIVRVKAGGIEKVFVRDSVSNAVTVGDMRKVNAPLDDPTEADVDTWWDADAVILTEEECFRDIK